MKAGCESRIWAGAAHLVLADGVAYLDPQTAVFEAMLEGWDRQQRSQFLRASTVKPRLDLVLASPAFERIAHPTVDSGGRRTPALRFGDPRVMALTGALCHTLLAATGFTNKNLRVLIAGLLGGAYTAGQMTYDLRRLRLAGLIQRLPHSNRYLLTDDGLRISVFYNKLYHRLLVPFTAANQPQAPPELRAALSTIDKHINAYTARARLRRHGKLDTIMKNLETKGVCIDNGVSG